MRITDSLRLIIIKVYLNPSHDLINIELPFTNTGKLMFCLCKVINFKPKPKKYFFPFFVMVPPYIIDFVVFSFYFFDGPPLYKL